MNITEFERLLRENTADEHFPPQEDKWLALESELQERKSKAFPIVFPWAAAASTALLIATGLYYFLSDSKKQVPQSARVERTESRPFPSRVMDSTHRTPELSISQSKKQVEVAITEKKKSTAAVLQRTDTPIVSEVPAAPRIRAAQPDPQAPVAQQPVQQQPARVPEAPELPEFQADPKERRLQLGITAFYGMSDISKGQYRLALDGRRNLSGRVFANVQLTAAAATIASNTDYTYQSVSMGPPGAAPSMAVQTTSAQYRGSVYTLGFSPGIGMQVTKKLALSVGPDVQKRLGGDLTLSNKADFRNPISHRSLIDERKEVADVDFGMQSAVLMNVNRNLAFTLLYRYGITEYLKTSEGAVRNSFISIGLSYRFMQKR
jgi:hypothetical protein